MKNFLILFFIFTIYSFNSVASAPMLASTNAKFLTQDFFIIPANSPLFKHPSSTRSFYNATEVSDCKKHISEIMCLVAPVSQKFVNEPRKCIPEDLSVSIQALQKIYDAFPPALAKIFCQIDTIYVERDFIGTAYASTDPQSHKAIIGIRESALRGELTLEKWISWKEQLSFGGEKKGYESRNDLVKVHAKIELPDNTNDFLYFAIAHEFGHIYDFSNKVNSFDCQSSDSPDACPAHPDSWSALSWEHYLPKYERTENDPWSLLAFKPNAIGAFSHREELCFYGCAPTHGNPTIMKPLYDSISQSNLLTTYSATNPWDDFAEATAFWAATSRYPTKYEVILPNGDVYNLAEKYQHNIRYQSKREWLENFYLKFNN
ncbi:MAG: hypothetical protein ACXVCY_13150 [Pseudobdellovibrionaceae bacterium]